MTLRTAATAVLVLLILPTVCFAQTQPDYRSKYPVDAGTRAAVISTLIELLRKNYVFPEVATRMETEIRRREKGGEYDRFTESGIFADALSEHLRGVSRDLHLNISFSPPAPPQKSASPTPGEGGGDSGAADGQARERAENYYFEHVERLPGNVGYLRLSEFVDAAQPEAAAAASAAMAFLRHTDALIIDLRRNFGGHPSMVALLLGYLLGPEPVLYTRFYDRPSGKISEAWTTVPRERYGVNRPVVVLTSRRTASAGESFTYFLKSLGRATVVGGRTLGAANPGGGYDLGSGFHAFIPTGRPINPLTGTNWEGIGIEPDVEWSPDGALRRGHFVALRRLLREETDPERRGRLEGVIESIDRER